MIKHMRRHRKDLKKNDSIQAYFKETALDVPEFTYELLESYAGNMDAVSLAIARPLNRFKLEVWPAA